MAVVKVVHCVQTRLNFRAAVKIAHREAGCPFSERVLSASPALSPLSLIIVPPLISDVVEGEIATAYGNSQGSPAYARARHRITPSFPFLSIVLTAQIPSN